MDFTQPSKIKRHNDFVAPVESFLRYRNEQRLMAELAEEREGREALEAQIVRLHQKISDLQELHLASRHKSVRDASRRDPLVENVISLISRLIPPAKP